ncbi:hypothetical protein GQ44DRAFT_712293 [Phaeosphaeriaceae sp. PMI808]|nr:hypothetical protein GQ44DRAFT_712293 [Phaeosphaeriaceae sp. PMI808]
MAAIRNKSPLNAQNKKRRKSITSVLGYDSALWFFKRVDFQVAKNPQPLCSIIKSLGDIVSGIFQMFHQHGHQERTSPDRVTYTENSARECYNQIENLVRHKLFNNLDDIEFFLSHKVDNAACHDIRKRSDELWHEAAMLHHQLKSENDLDITPESPLCGLLKSCKDSLRKLYTSLEELPHEISDSRWKEAESRETPAKGEHLQFSNHYYSQDPQSLHSFHADEHGRFSFDRSSTRTDEHAMARHLFAQTTPFSQFSDTPIEASEATAVSIYPHNNHSLLVVQQVSGPGAVDSPLKNPRPPPEPPVIKFIPPTPAEELERQFSPGPPKRSDSHPRRRSLLGRFGLIVPRIRGRRALKSPSLLDVPL